MARKINLFDLQPFDQVLVRDLVNKRDPKGVWKPALFSGFNKDDYKYITTDGNIYNYCVPYWGEFKSLIGTKINVFETDMISNWESNHEAYVHGYRNREADIIKQREVLEQLREEQRLVNSQISIRTEISLGNTQAPLAEFVKGNGREGDNWRYGLRTEDLPMRGYGIYILAVDANNIPHIILRDKLTKEMWRVFNLKKWQPIEL